MKQFYKPSLVIVGATCLAIAAVGMAQRLPDLNSGPAARDATQLSSVFRQVSQDVLPSIVSIENPQSIGRYPKGLAFWRRPSLPEILRKRPALAAALQEPVAGRQRTAG